MTNDNKDHLSEDARSEMYRREFLSRVAAIAGGAAVAVVLVPAAEAKTAAGQIVPADDPRTGRRRRRRTCSFASGRFSRSPISSPTRAA